MKKQKKIPFDVKPKSIRIRIQDAVSSDGISRPTIFTTVDFLIKKEEDSEEEFAQANSLSLLSTNEDFQKEVSLLVSELAHKEFGYAEMRPVIIRKKKK